MNDLGLALAWQAAQVAGLMTIAFGLLAMARRRGPASGARVASTSLGLAAILGVLAFAPRAGWGGPVASSPTAPVAPSTPSVASIQSPTGGDDRVRPSLAIRWAWARFDGIAAGTSARWRPWGAPIAALAMAGMGLGLARLVVGLGAVGLCRRRSRGVVDPAMVALFGEIRSAMGHRRPVGLREGADLISPATAGWLRPVVLLPVDWPTWDAQERRAVLAHELAHVVRGDYAAGLVARLAVALNPFHPMVRGMAGRLQLQQELAADAMGAHFSGGRAGYLATLASLALRQDGRSPTGPARAFLPAPGTLIRRIEMLRNQNATCENDRSRTRRALTTAPLIALTIALASFRVPAGRAEDEAPTPPSAVIAPAVPVYIRDGCSGVVSIRPSALVRRLGNLGYLARVQEMMAVELTGLTGAPNKIDTNAPGFRKLVAEDIEQVTCGVAFGTQKANGQDLHTLMLAGLTVRMAAPIDWPAFFKQWRVELIEVRDGGRTFYQLGGPLQTVMGKKPCLYFPDDRTLVFDEDIMIRAAFGPGAPKPPTVLLGPEWDRASRGVLAYAIDNRDGAFAKNYDLKRSDDAIVLAFFGGVDRWTLGVDDADALTFHALATARDGEAGTALVRAVETYRERGREEIGRAKPDSADPILEGLRAMLRATADRFLAGLTVRQSGRSIEVEAQGFGKLADLAPVIRAELLHEKPRADDTRKP